MTVPPSTPSAPPPSPRCWTLFAVDGTVDVEVTAPDSAPLGSVLPVLTRMLGVPVDGLWDGSLRLPEDVPLSAPALAHGALLGLGRPAPQRAQRSSALELHVVGGPEAGRTLPLGQGRHVLGRGSDATVVIDDPDVSRRHVAVQVGGGRITVADLGSTNGTRLGSDDLGAEPRPWPVGTVLRLGGTAITIAGPGQSPASVTAGSGGRRRLRPSPRVEPPVPDVEIAFPRTPDQPAPRRLSWVAVALPAVGGVLMAWLLDAPTFLFFALLSPVVALGTWLSDRWSGRRTGRRAIAAHAVEVLAARARLEEALHSQVRALHSAAPDLATLTAAARRRTDVLWSHTVGAGSLVVRLGTGNGSTGVIRVDGDGTRRRQTAPHVPVVVDLADDGGLAVIGPADATAGVLRAVVAQLTALHPPEQVELVLLADAAGLARWAWARWLPHLAPSAVHVRAAGHTAPGTDDDLLRRFSTLLAGRRAAPGRQAGPPRTSTVVIVDRPLDPRLVTLLREARDVGVAVLTSAVSAGALPVGSTAALRLGGETGHTAVLGRSGQPDVHVAAVDRLPPATAERFARDLAALAPAVSDGALPRAVRLLDLPSSGVTLDADGRLVGSWCLSRDSLQVALGRAAAGPFGIDLVRSGPHVLVAGTTGSGKSELLQTLIAGLARSHPPDRCSFLLVDYKGGAAFAEAATLPHTVGVVTDLDGQSTARALRSLTAELARRERILAAHRVPDIAALPDAVELARLVIVVDEFATLAEELPSFVPGLVSIAQRGRSLGVHLVLATQRPGGVVSPEIRANCTLRICLRTTDEADSRDVLGTPSAVHLPIDAPGRAYVRVGSAEPTLLQTARVATSAPPVSTDGPRARRWSWPAPAPRAAPETAGPTDLARLTAAIGQRCAASGARLPHRPWRPPLPDRLLASELPPSRPSPTVLPLGLVDLPDTQAQVCLELDLADGGTWLVVGGPGSGRSTVLRTVLREAVARSGPGALHVHVVETGGGSLAAEAAALPHTGTVINGSDRLRTVRLVERLADQVAARRAGSDATAGPRILLLVDGIEELVAIVEDADPGHGSTTLARLLRDGAAAGLTCVVTADRAVPGGRLAALAQTRIVLPLPDRADYAVAGVPPRAVPGHRPPGRALVGEDAVECQLALPREPAARALTHPAPACPAPLCITELPADPVLPLPSAPIAPGDRPLLLPVGPGGDDGAPLTVDLARTGGFLVAGPPGSGRTSALDAFVRHLLAAGVPVLRLGHPPPTPVAAEGAPVRWVDVADAAAVHAWAAALPSGAGVVVADDVGAPAELAALSALTAPAGAGRIALIAAAHAAQLSTHYQGPVAALRRARVGLLLSPGPGDADLLGVRLPRTPLPARPGAGWVVTGSRVERVQVARHRTDGPQTS